MPSLLQNHEISLILTTVLLPALSIPLLYILPKKINPGWITSVIGLLQIGLSTHTLIAVYQGTAFHKCRPWFVLPHGLSVQIGIYTDLLNTLLLVMITLISWVIALYSITYLPAHTNFKRYFSLYNLSLTAMSWLLIADNLWGILIGWELLSIFSCLLIGFWYQLHDSTQASTYAWVVSKLGSICFLVGILLVVVELGNCNLSTLSSVDLYTTSHLSNNLVLAGCCFVTATLTKSAQFPFFSWLPQAMVAPTPVSALLHTATVLSAGVYLLIRVQPILSPEIHTLLIFIGHLTVFMGACAALAQTHIKHMLAYSTLSHLGYVMATIGLGNAYMGVIYLVVHAFAKACLFLIAGIIAKFLQTKDLPEQEAYQMPRMGGIIRHLPLVTASYLVVTWGLGLLPGLIGFTAKENIVSQTFLWASHPPSSYLHLIIPLLALVSTGLTILYMGQAFVRIFLEKSRWEISPSSLPSSASLQRPWLLQGSMVMCAGCVLLASYVLDNFPLLVTASPEGAWQSILERVSYGLLLLVILWLIINWLKSTSWVATALMSQTKTLAPLKGWIIISSLMGLRNDEPFGVATVTTSPRNEGRPINKPHSFYHLFLHGWYLDTCFTSLARQVLACSRLVAQVEKWFFGGLIKCLTVGYVGTAHMAHWVDNQLIAGIGNGVAAISQQGSKLYLHLQSGRTQLYILWTCIGMGLLVVIWMVLI